MAQLIGLKIRTRLSYEALDNILGQYCRGGYQITLGGLDTTGKFPRKIMILAFADAEDRERARHVFTVRGAVAAGGAPKTGPKTGSVAA